MGMVVPHVQFRFAEVVKRARICKTVCMGNKDAPKREKRKPPKNK